MTQSTSSGQEKRSEGPARTTSSRLMAPAQPEPAVANESIEKL